MKKYYRTTVTLPENLMHDVWDLLRGEDAHHFQTVEIGTESQHHPHYNPIPGEPRPQQGRGPKPISEMRWAVELWPHFKPVFLRANGHVVHTRSPELVEVLVKLGRSKNGITPMITAWHRAGYIKRERRGEYKLA